MERILQRDRVWVIGSLAALTVLCWIYLVILATDMAKGDMSLMGMGNMAGGMNGMNSMSGSQTNDMAKSGVVAMTSTMMAWKATTFVLMLIMWWVMMVGMMVPSAAPMILLFAAVTRKQSAGENPGFPIALFTTAYILIWGIFSVVATTAQWGLTELALVSPMMEATSFWLTVGLLLACGVYQLTPLKQACLGKCRSPLSFLMTGWHKGNWGAMRMGLSHGAYCVGCCWLLMLLLFVGGVMNLFWVALLAILVLAEKLFPRGNLIGKASGVAMIVLALYMLIPTTP